MLAKKPEIILFTNTTDEQFVKDICAGIEEDGLLYRCMKVEGQDANLLAKEACSEATIGVGISVVGQIAVLTAENLEIQKPLQVVQDADKVQARVLGKNAARYIKKMPLVIQ